MLKTSLNLALQDLRKLVRGGEAWTQIRATLQLTGKEGQRDIRGKVSSSFAVS